MPSEGTFGMSCAFTPISSVSSITDNSTMSNASSWKARVISGNKSTQDMRSKQHSGLSRHQRKSKGRSLNKTVSDKVHLEKNNQKKEVMNAHVLTTPWTLYYHSPSLQDWSVTSYMKVATFATVEEFWAVFSKLPESNFHMGMFFFMRNDIKPTWEDPQNIKGGCWSYKVPMCNIFPVWKQMAALLVGESLSTSPMLLNGLSISPKRGFCIVKIWGNDSKMNDTHYLRLDDIELLKNYDALYTRFEEKK